MKVIACGGRDFKDEELVHKILDKVYLRFPFTLLIEGGATGADRFASRWAAKRNIPSKRFPAAWNKHGPAAGRKRNQKMLVEGKPNLVVAFPGGAGTRHVTMIAKLAGVRVITVNKDGTHDRI